MPYRGEATILAAHMLPKSTIVQKPPKWMVIRLEKRLSREIKHFEHSKNESLHEIAEREISWLEDNTAPLFLASLQCEHKLENLGQTLSEVQSENRSGLKASLEQTMKHFMEKSMLRLGAELHPCRTTRLQRNWAQKTFGQRLGKSLRKSQAEALETLDRQQQQRVGTFNSEVEQLRPWLFMDAEQKCECQSIKENLTNLTMR